MTELDLTINGTKHTLRAERLPYVVSYALVVRLSGLIGLPTVTFKAGDQQGELTAGKQVALSCNAIFNVADTSRA